MKSKIWNMTIFLVLMSVIVSACGAPATATTAPTTAAAVTAAPVATTAPTATEAPTALPPIKIGISLSLSGDFSADGQGFQQGYQLWADTVNKNGGLLGRQVQLDIVSDASSPDQVQANYEKLITVDKVDLVFGPYSSLLTKPSSVVADRYGYAMVEGAGGAPSVFNRGLKNIFDVALPILFNLDSFGQFLLSLPADQRPASIAYATEDDPFTSPQVERLKTTMEAAGIKTAYYEVMPAETTDFNPTADKVIASKADIFVGGFIGLPSLQAFMQRFQQQHYNPKAFIATAGPDLGNDFLTAVGAGNAEGLMTGNLWYAGANYPGNADFVKTYIAQYGGTPEGINGDVAEGYSVGQVVQQAVEKNQSLDNAKLIAELHSGDTFTTVEGPVKFDDVGQNTAAVALLFQWQAGKFIPVYPAASALATPEYPKANWP